MIPRYTKEELLKIKQKRIELPTPTGLVVKVNTEAAIIDAIEDAEDGTTIIIAKGHYKMFRDCILTSHRVTIKGETGNREDVILDAEMEYDDGTRKYCTRIGAPAIIKITHARNVTIADLTIANCPKYGILFFGDGNVQSLKIYNVKFHNIWARGLKGTFERNYDDKGMDAPIVPATREHCEHVRPRNGEVRNCLFIADHTKKNDQDQFQGDYIAGMDMMNLKDWVIADNIFIGIKGKNGGARGGIFIWQESENITVENNIFFDCDKGVNLGNPSGKNGREFHIKNGIVRNNIILGGTNKAIEVDYGENIKISGNKISSDVRTEYPAFRVVDILSTALIEKNEITKDNFETYQLDPKVKVEGDIIS